MLFSVAQRTLFTRFAMEGRRPSPTPFVVRRSRYARASLSWSLGMGWPVHAGGKRCRGVSADSPTVGTLVPARKQALLTAAALATVSECYPPHFSPLSWTAS